MSDVVTMGALDGARVASLHERMLALLRERSVRTGQFTLSSGRVSDLYVDVKQTSLDAEGAAILGQLLLARLHPDVAAIGGLTLGADPLVCAVAPLSFLYQRPVRAFIVRKEPKGHGTNQYIEGVRDLAPGAPVAILEDTATTGASLLKAVQRAVDAGFRVVQCLTVVDREEGAAEAVAAAGYRLEALTTRSELLG
jgi:orotate phosphoribosyltransferase